MTLWYSVEGIKLYLSTTGRGVRLKSMKAIQGYTALKPKDKTLLADVFAAHIGVKKKKSNKRKKPKKKPAESSAKCLGKMTVRELKAELKTRGLPVSGNKAVLINRLNNAES